MKKSILRGLAHLFNFAMNGAATGVMAGVGTTMAGIPLSGKQILASAVSGAVIATARHLQTSPLITLSDEENVNSLNK